MTILMTGYEDTLLDPSSSTVALSARGVLRKVARKDKLAAWICYCLAETRETIEARCARSGEPCAYDGLPLGVPASELLAEYNAL